ncbi:MAG: right-handed parallel beta-helix repeat-containing protein [Ruminococcaceae bacterium]|nr:right-handed parallel beta-helix repeat-containing protein [Oscillospiraceae bacterium]
MCSAENKSMISVKYNKMTFEYSDMKTVRAEIRKLLASDNKPSEIIVNVPAGTYSSADFVFTAEDCSEDTKIIYQAEGEVIVTAGIQVSKDQWKDPDEKMSARFSPEALPHIKMISLSDFGMTQDDWGKYEVAIGTSNTSKRYDDGVQGCNNGFFTGGKRMTKARYPNGEYDFLEDVLEQGELDKNVRNPYGGSYRISRRTAERIKKWADPNKAWMYGYFAHDWADGSTPVEIDIYNRIVYPKYVAWGGANIDKHFTPFFCFYNVPEELDSEGEWYLDRETGNIYFWAFDGSENAEFYYKADSLLDCKNVVNMEFRGFTLIGTAGAAITATGKNLILDKLVIKNIEEWAIIAQGTDITISNCDISHTGKGGINVKGGDRATLTHSNNRITNNYIHNFAEVFKTYQGGIVANGCGHKIDHNEVCYAPHAAMSMGGDENIAEYNYIHHAVMLSKDAGTIYCGGQWTSRGSVWRYNLISDIGDEGWFPSGIYFDDGMSGQTAYGNIVLNVRGLGFLCGGGREHTIINNLIVNCGSGFVYDSRMYDGFNGQNSFWERAVSHDGPGSMWSTLRDVPYKDEFLASKYPLRAKMTSFAESDPKSPDCPCTPAYSRVAGNVVIKVNYTHEYDPGLAYKIDDPVYEYSTVENNVFYETLEEGGWDEVNRVLRDDSPVYKDIPGFERIPIEEIGRK